VANTFVISTLIVVFEFSERMRRAAFLSFKVTFLVSMNESSFALRIEKLKELGFK
jgi:hypothetical protein